MGDSNAYKSPILTHESLKLTRFPELKSNFGQIRIDSNPIFSDSLTSVVYWLEPLDVDEKTGSSFEQRATKPVQDIMQICALSIDGTLIKGIEQKRFDAA